VITPSELAQRRSLSLDEKIAHSKIKIREWYNHFGGDVYVSYSGGKDSTVLLHLARSIFPDIPAVYCDTGLEFPEIKEFVKATPNTTIIRPKLSFREIIDKHGYPVVSKEMAKFISIVRGTKSEEVRRKYITGIRGGGLKTYYKLSAKWRYLINAPFKISPKCCYHLKLAPFKQFQKETGLKTIIGTLTSDSHRRLITYIMHGCNAYEGKTPSSKPLSIWTEQNILEYIKRFNIPVCSVYGDIEEKPDGSLHFTKCARTGCLFCMFGAHLEGLPNRFMLLQKTHPKLWEYCIYKLGIGRVLDYMGIPYSDPLELL
jgi:3'-phosphoadenosine 5'-phosphosulfate sulfotransferase (PAPS reductase)/FAD synthetase